MTRCKVGCAVTYIDEVGVEYPALVTAVWSETCVNLLYVLTDPNRQDPYGQQISRQSSCCHLSINSAQRNCWK